MYDIRCMEAPEACRGVSSNLIIWNVLQVIYDIRAWWKIQRDSVFWKLSRDEAWGDVLTHFQQIALHSSLHVSCSKDIVN